MTLLKSLDEMALARIGKYLIGLLHLMQLEGCLLFLFFARPVQLVGVVLVRNRR